MRTISTNHAVSLSPQSVNHTDSTHIQNNSICQRIVTNHAAQQIVNNFPKLQLQSVLMACRCIFISPSKSLEKKLLRHCVTGDYLALKIFLNASPDIAIPNDRLILSEAIVQYQPKILEVLLSDSRFNPENDSNLVIQAIHSNSSECLKLLLADSRTITSDLDFNLLQFCFDQGYLEAFQVLLDDGRIDPTTQNNSLLNIAVIRDDLEFVRLLLNDERIDPTVDNNKFLCHAMSGGQLELVKLLSIHPKIDLFLNTEAEISIAASDNQLDLFYLILKNEHQAVRFLSETNFTFMSCLDFETSPDVSEFLILAYLLKQTNRSHQIQILTKCYPELIGQYNALATMTAYQNNLTNLFMIDGEPTTLHIIEFNQYQRLNIMAEAQNKQFIQFLNQKTHENALHEITAIIQAWCSSAVNIPSTLILETIQNHHPEIYSDLFLDYTQSQKQRAMQTLIDSIKHKMYPQMTH